MSIEGRRLRLCRERVEGTQPGRLRERGEACGVRWNGGAGSLSVTGASAQRGRANGRRGGTQASGGADGSHKRSMIKLHNRLGVWPLPGHLPELTHIATSALLGLAPLSVTQVIHSRAPVRARRAASRATADSHGAGRAVAAACGRADAAREEEAEAGGIDGPYSYMAPLARCAPRPPCGVRCAKG